LQRKGGLKSFPKKKWVKHVSKLEREKEIGGSENEGRGERTGQGKGGGKDIPRMVESAVRRKQANEPLKGGRGRGEEHLSLAAETSIKDDVEMSLGGGRISATVVTKRTE